MSTLQIQKKNPTGYDFISLGALVIRLDPGIVPFAYAEDLKVHVSGGEYNVAANLSQGFNQRCGIVSAMVDYPLGAKIENEVRKMGVTGFYKRYEHDGVRGPNMAQVYSDRGQGLRPPIVFYNRANEAAARLDSGSFDWDQIFSSGIRWFHSGGIFSALSPKTPNLLIKAMQSAKEKGAIISFDLNYREKLWKSIAQEGEIPQKIAQRILSSIVENVDVLIGNEEDLQMGLGLQGPQVASQGKLDPTSFYAMMETVAKRFPNIKAVANSMREVKSTNRHDWSAVLWYDGKGYQAPTCTLDIYDRVGGGDGFAAGLIYGLLQEKSPEEALRLGWAHGALLTSFPGDTTMATLSQVEALANGASARIQR
ncbi:sugar kinase [uncultured Sphaerochaeta sp.]|uniref:sugar kinase n=1 Tax=uncultured Sphaerochaeta sp. TaxID=886478 RepID=UPI002A0A390F|nr:sugar kinase [uncultured Sphaerochaeta sp.]